MALDAKQTGYVRIILDQVKALGLPQRAGVIAIETAIDESNIYVLANSNVPASLAIPHDGVGSDHHSVGIFQQQTPMWGTARDCMDPATSTRKFLDALMRINWQGMTNWMAAQTVQGSGTADGSNYERYDAQAQQIVSEFWHGRGPKPPPPEHVPPLHVDYFSRTHNQRVPDVRIWQAKMQSRGWMADGNPLAVDGIFGPLSESVCKSFQAEKGLLVDGKVGPQTWHATWTAPVT